MNVDSWLGHDRQLVSTTKKRSGMFNAALTLRREAFTLGGVMDQASVFFFGGPTETVEVYPRFHKGTYTQGSITIC